MKNILGEEAERFNVTLLLDNGVDMHSYQPAVKDIATAGSSDLFIYVGGESDTWVADALKEAKNKDPLNTTFGCIALSSVFILLFLNEVFKSAFVF